MRLSALMILLVVISPPAVAEDERVKLVAEPHVFESASGESVEAELGELRVPENRAAEHTRMITLRFVRFPSTAEKPGAPIVYLAGGPGGSGIAAARGSRFPLFMALRELGDVIAFDQRGTGMSEPDLDCSEQYVLPFDEPATRYEASKILADAAAECFERLRKDGADLSGYTTVENAADLVDLRRALGAEKLRLIGISYGSHLALAAMKNHPDGIERVVLAGPEPLHHTLKLPSDQQTLLEEISRLATIDATTRKQVPDLLGSIEKLLDELREEPQTVSVTDPRSGATIPVTVGVEDLQGILAGMLRGPDSFATMPDLVYRLEQDDWLALAIMSAGQRFGTLPGAMSLVMDCASGASAAWLKRIEREAKTTLLGDAINSFMPGICQGLGVPDLGDEFRAPVESDIPTLVIAGTLDGRTPSSNAAELEKQLGDVKTVVIEGAGHGTPLFMSSPKIAESIAAFMRGEDVPHEVITLEDPVSFV
ncbi:MAG: alpha/beta hydrolase, partial [Thermoanaerobaculia bacterium]|nr:alpha/beta hydrolase [Thermoanaerobaculia bacterium]